MIKDIYNIDPRFLEEDERIVSFLKGKMSAEEEQKFMEDLDANPELKQNAIVTARLVKGLKEVGTLRDREMVDAFLASTERGVDFAVTAASHIANFADVQESACYSLTDSDEWPHEVEEKPAACPEKEVPNRKKAVPARKWLKWLSIAASLVTVVWLGMEYGMYKTTTGLGEQYGNAFTSSMIVRGAAGQSEASKKLEQLFADVKDNRNIGDAIHDLSLYWELSMMETYNDYTDYSAEIGWNLAIAHLKDNDRKNAKKVLYKLVKTTEEGSAINKKAKELLEKV